MQNEVSSRGIERKILTSIVWVSIPPMLLALGMGLLVARQGRSTAVREALTEAVGKTAEAFRIGRWGREERLKAIAANETTVSVLQGTASGTLSQTDAWMALREVVGPLSANATSGFVLTIYNAANEVMFTTDPEWETETENESRRVYVGGPKKDAQDRTGMLLVPKEPSGHYWMRIFETVRGSHGEVLGHASEMIDITSVLKYALGSTADNSYQFAYVKAGDDKEPDKGYAIIDSAPRNAVPQLEVEPLDQELVQALLKPAPPHNSQVVGQIRLKKFTSAGKTDNVFLAYKRIYRTQQSAGGVYMVVYQPTSTVFSSTNMWSFATVLACVLLILVLGMRVYLNVHRNIVRPVMLLNEGAQIIGQGDLELKLVIHTADELEELANSFNKMALALQRNISSLEHSREEYRSLITSIRDGIYQSAPDGELVFVNPAALDMFGYRTPEEVLGQNIRDFFLEEIDYARLSDALRKNGYAERTRVWMRQRDGAGCCIELSANVIRDDAGDVTGIEGVFRDITKGVHLEEEARERAERISVINQIANVINSNLEAGRLYDSLVVELKKLVNFDYAGLALLNERGDAFNLNQIWPKDTEETTQTCSLDKDDSCAAWVARQRRCLLVEDWPAVQQRFVDTFASTTRSCLCVPLYATGRIIGTLNLGSDEGNAFTSHDVQVLEQMAPHVAVAIGNAQLLDNLKRSLEEVTLAREKLHQVNDELKTLDEMKTNLLSNVSHELRTPLVSIMGYTDMILNGKAGPITDTQREYLGIGMRNVEKLVTLIENLLDFSRLHRGTEKLAFDTFDLTECARSSMQIIQPVADGRSIELELVCPDEACTVEGDKGKIGQVFNNLLSNAVKFNSANGTVRIELKAETDRISVAVSDTGIGIPPEALDKVFTRFYQYDSSSTRKYGGTGIGLSIAQDIVRLHGSRITVESEVNKGTTFRFSLPTPFSLRPQVQAPPIASPENHMLVMLITPDRGMASQIREFVSEELIDVIHAHSADDAVVLGKRHRPDCILLDPPLDDAVDNQIQVIFDNIRDIPLVLLTNDEALYRRHSDKVASRLNRGFRRSSLLSSIRNALKLRRGKDAAPSTRRPLGSKILCVDDDEEILMFMVNCLQEEGYTVDTCTSGGEALRMASSREYATVLMDIAMPGMDGWESCRRLKSDPQLSDIHVFMVTAKPIEDATDPTGQIYADGLLLKPFKPSDLLDLLRTIS